ncbi:MAG TPA: cobalamin-dependent protein, partial [Kiloniellales bacterium]|nr:cobalamin-dependent protein [Kiloniellales bacterium]
MRDRKRILIVNAFFDEYRRTRGSPARVPRAMGPEYLAGAFAAERSDIRLYNEQYSGPLRDLALLAWCDMLVLTGVTTAFDRMRQLTAYVRALNPKAVVVAGGPPVRALPRLSQRIFDYACTGDVEELQGVIAAVFGESHVAAEIFPRYDLGPRRGLLGYVESSRNCNFRCSFCSLTGEGGRYRRYDLDYLQRQILATGKRQIVFIDNNFYGNDRDYLMARLALLKELRAAGRIDG